MLQLALAPDVARLGVPEHLAASLLGDEDTAAVRGFADRAAALLGELPCGVLFRIGALRWDAERSRRLARALVGALRAALLRQGAPAGLSVGYDRPGRAGVLAGCGTRTLLPHHEGAHCSYLTPSRRDDPTWDPALRHYSEEGIRSTQEHRLYQGLFLADPGEGLSMTTFYPLVPILHRAFANANGRPARSVAELAAWEGECIRYSLATRPQHGSRYLTLGAQLGRREPIYQGVAVHCAEAGFTDEEQRRFPDLDALQAPAGGGPAAALLERLLIAALGLTLEEFRARYELCLASERFDLLFWENLTLLHGGLLGGPGREMEPVCLYLREPAGDEYESWLGRLWRSRP